MAKALNVSLAVTADTSQAKAELQALQHNLQQLASSSTSIQLGINSKSIQEASNAALQLSAHLKAATDANTGLLNFSQFESQIRRSGQSIEQYGAKLMQLGPKGQQAFTQMTQAIIKSEIPMKRMSSVLGQFGTVISNTIRWQASSSLIHGFIGSIQKAYNYAQDLNQSLNNIQIVTQMSDNQMSKFAESANKAAKSLSTTTTSYTDAALIYYQQGIRDQNEINERTSATIKMANVTGQSAEKVSNQMTAIWNNFATGGENLEYYADVITALGAATASSSEEISTGLQKFASVADTVGLSYENATAALATITATTRQSADSVGTGLRTLFARLESLKLGETLEDGVDLTKYTKALQTVGVQVLDTNGNLKDMDTILDDLGERWGNISDTQKVALAQTVGGVRQYTTLMALMNNFDFYKENVNIAKNSEGTLQKQQEIYEKSWAASSKRVRAAMETIYSTLINDKFFINFNDGFAKVLDTINQIIKGLGGMKGLLASLSSIGLTMFAPQLTQGLYNSFVGLSDLFASGSVESRRSTVINNLAGMMSGGYYDKATGQVVGAGSTKDNYVNLINTQQAYYNNQAFMSPWMQNYGQSLIDSQQQAIQRKEDADAQVAAAAAKKQESRADMYASTSDFRNNTRAAAILTGAHNYMTPEYFQSLPKDMVEANKLITEAYTSYETTRGQFIEQRTLVDALGKNPDLLNAVINGIEGTEFNEADVKPWLDELTDSTLSYFKDGLNTDEVSRILTDKARNVSTQGLQNVGIVTTGEGFNQYGARVDAEAQARVNNRMAKRGLDQFKNAPESMEQLKDPFMVAAQNTASIARGLSSALAAATSLSQVIKTIGDDSLSTSDKITQITSGLASTGIQMTMAFSALKSLSFLTTGWAAGITIAITAIMTALPYVINYIDNLTTTPEEKLAILQESTELAEARATSAKAAYDNLLSATTSHAGLVDQLKDLTKGTLEYEAALIKANAAAYALINDYNLSAEDWYKDTETGAVVLTDEAQERMQQQALVDMERTQALSYAAQAVSSSFKATEVDIPNEIQEEFQKDYNTFFSQFATDYLYNYISDLDNIEGAINSYEGRSKDLRELFNQYMLGEQNTEAYQQLMEQLTTNKNVQDGLEAYFESAKKEFNRDFNLTQYGVNPSDYGMTTEQALQSLMRGGLPREVVTTNDIEAARAREVLANALINQQDLGFSSEFQQAYATSLSKNAGYINALNTASQIQVNGVSYDLASQLANRQIVNAGYEDSIEGFQQFYIDALAQALDISAEEAAANFNKLTKTEEYKQATDKQAVILEALNSELALSAAESYINGSSEEILQIFKQNPKLQKSFENFSTLTSNGIAELVTEAYSTGNEQIQGIANNYLNRWKKSATKFGQAAFEGISTDIDGAQLKNKISELISVLGPEDFTSLLNLKSNLVSIMGEAGNDKFAEILLDMEGANGELKNFYESLDFSKGANNVLKQIKSSKSFKEESGNLAYEQFLQIRDAIGGDSGIFQNLYNSILTDETLMKKLSDTFKSTGSITAETIYELADSSQAVADALEIGTFNAEGLASALEAINDEGLNINAESVSNVFLKVMSTAGAVKNQMAEVFEYIDNYQKTRSAADIGAFYQGLVKDVNTSISQGLFGDDLFKQSFGELFGDQGLKALNDFLDRTSGLTEKEKQNAWEKDEAMTPYRKAMAEVEKTGHMGGMYGYYLNNQGMTGENVVNGVYTDAQGNTITRGKNGIYSINGTEAFGYDKKGGFAVYDESFYDQFQTQEDFTNYLQDAFGMSETQAKSMSSDLASHGQGINKKWTQGSVKKALTDFEAELGDEGSGLLSADELAAFEKKYGDYLKEGSDERKRFDALKKNSFGVGKDFDFSKNTQGQEAWENLNTAMQDNGALGLQEYLDRSLDGSKNINDLVSSFERLGYSAEEAGQFISSNADHFEDFTYKMRDANGEVNNFNLEDLAEHFKEEGGRDWDQILEEDFGGNILKAFQQMQQDLQKEFEQTELSNTISEGIKNAFGEDGIQITFDGDQASLDAILESIPDEIPIKIVYTDENGNSVILDGAGNPTSPSSNSSSGQGAPTHAPGPATTTPAASSDVSLTPTVDLAAAQAAIDTAAAGIAPPPVDISTIYLAPDNPAILAAGVPTVTIPTRYGEPSNSPPGGGRAAGMNNAPGFAGGNHSNSDFQGIAVTGELGPELWIHDGQPSLTGVHGRNKIFVSKDDQIFTAAETREILRKNPSLQTIPGFSRKKKPIDRAYGTDGGGNNGGSGKKKENDYTPERYHVISRQLAMLQRQYDRLEKAKENAYGTNILDSIDDEIEAQDELIAKQKELIAEVEKYKKQDLKKLDKLGIKYKLDEDGNISNWNALQKKYEEKAQNGDEDAKKKWEAIKQYEETVDKLNEEMDNMQDMIYKQMELRLKKITLQAELKVKFDEKQMKLLEHFLDKLDDNMYDSAHALSMVESIMGRTTDQIQATRDAITGLFTEMTDKKGNKINVTLEQFLAMTEAERDALDINGKFGEELENQIQNLLDYVEALEEYKTKGVEELADAFDELSGNIEDAMGMFDYYTRILTTMRDIVDLQNIKFPKSLRSSVEDVQSALMETSENSIQAYQDYYRKLEEQANNIRNHLAATTDTDLRKQYQEQLDQLEEKMRDCMSNITDLWQATLSQAKEDFERTLDWIVEDYESSLSGIYGDLDTLGGAFERERSARDRYAEDYEKYYQLSKLQRTIAKDIDKANLGGYKTNKNLLALMEEINKAQETGQDMSSYDLELLQKRYEYFKALADLEDARAAKSQVRLQRDRNGNWGYVYTASEDELDDVQQKVDDKLYELQKFIRESSDDLEDQIQDLLSTYIQTRTEMVKNGASAEALQEFDDYYQDQLNFLNGEWEKSLNDAGSTVGTAQDRYKKDNFDIIDIYNETATAQVSAAASTTDLIGAATNAMTEAAGAMTTVVESYQGVVDRLNTLVGGEGNFGDNFKTFVDSINEASKINLGLTEEEIQNFNDTYEKILDAAKKFENDFMKIYKPIIKENEKLIKDLMDALETLNRYKNKNKDDKKTGGGSGGGSGGGKNSNKPKGMTQTTLSYVNMDYIPDGAYQHKVYADIKNDQTKKITDKHVFIKSESHNWKTTGSKQECTKCGYVTWLPSKVTDVRKQQGHKKQVGEGTVTIPTKKPTSSGGCFAPGTQILMADYTLKNIEDIKIGEKVISYNELTQTFEPKTVNQSYVHHHTPYMIRLYFDNNFILDLTPGHPLLSVNNGWKSLDVTNSLYEHKTITTLLQFNDEIINISGNSKVIDIKILEINNNYDSYNIEVDTCHTFLANGFVVHNVVAKYDTGGYTGDWGSTEGKLAILHEKEQIFNKDDTTKLLMASRILQTIDIQARYASGAFGSLSSPNIGSAAQIIEQSVNIQASFPNAVNHAEIEEAFNNLSNKAIQYANRKNK